MTNGTSQGLFVVVAIVIFGIFVGLAYTVFGSDGLSNDLKGIFTTAVEQANNDLNGMVKGNTEDIYSKYKDTGHLIFDFNRKYTDTNEKRSTINGRAGTINSEGIYEQEYTVRLDNKETYIDSLFRIYIYSDLEKAADSKVKDLRVFVNNKEVHTSFKTANATIPDGTDNVFYYAVFDDLKLGKDTVYDFKLQYIMDNNTYYEFEKSIIIKGA